MMRRPVDLRALLLVAGKANLGLGTFVSHLVVRGVDFVARGTCYVAALVCTSLPVRTFCILIVTGETGFILYCCIAWRVRAGCSSFCSKKNIRSCAPLLIRITIQVFFALAVARLAIGSAGIRLDTMFGLIDSQDRFSLTFIMAPRADRIPVHSLSCCIHGSRSLGNRTGSLVLLLKCIISQCGRYPTQASDKHTQDPFFSQENHFSPQFNN